MAIESGHHRRAGDCELGRVRIQNNGLTSNSGTARRRGMQCPAAETTRVRITSRRVNRRLGANNTIESDPENLQGHMYLHVAVPAERICGTLLDPDVSFGRYVLMFR